MREFVILIVSVLGGGAFAEQNAGPVLYLTTETENVTVDMNNKLDRVNPAHPIKFIIHGFTENANLSYYTDMARAYHIRGTYNVIRVDYSYLSQANYLVAVSSVEQLGNYVGDFIVKLNRVLNVPLGNVHIIGHSMGAHVAGAAGKRVHAALKKKVSRISGLDPARPLFESRQPGGRLAAGDAQSVEIIHTDKGIFGYGASLGTADFFPNGGKRLQPGCEAVPHFMMDFMAQSDNWPNLQPADNYCSHQMSVKFFVKSINTKIKATSCACYKEYLKGSCDKNEQVLFGENAPSDASGEYYLALTP